ncbi:glutaredoxin family protein [Bauldia sp.]|uniref:glutaredoxin family protein n=1 Tax=Bauldia sp. TaxID=2575872 RepID=UPI003BAA634B
MAYDALRQSLIDLFKETAEAHHTAFAATDGADPDWPMWYGEHLRDPISKVLGVDFTRSDLVFCLMTADLEHTARESGEPWQASYADHFIERFATSESPQSDTLALYMTPTCPFCRLVLNALEDLDVDIELRDIYADRDHRDALIAARGRGTVPVLRITSGDEDRWMPESRDIIRYLQETYGQKEAA